METLFIVGALTAFNAFIILWKWYSNRIFNAGLDLLLLCAVISVFGGSTELLIIGVIASSIISIGLIFMIPKRKPRTSTTLTPTEIAAWLDKYLT